METDTRKHLVILGGGFAGYRLALGVSPQHYRVSIVSPRDHFLFTPLLASTTVGTIEFRSIIEPLRNVARDISSLQATAEAIDFSSQQVRCMHASGAFTLKYDKLVIAVGAESKDYGIPGVREHAYFLKELKDARRIRQQVIASVEQATLPHQSQDERDRLLHFVVVGGGPTGVEFAGELHDFIHQDLKEHFPHLKDYFRITLLEAGDQILTGFDETLGQYTQRIFKKRNIAIKTASHVCEVTERGVKLADGTHIACALVVWSTGVGPTKLVVDSGLSLERGRIVTDENLVVPGHPNVYAMGDCAIVKGKNYPMTAQLAQQQGKYLAGAFYRLILGRRIKPFRYIHLGMLAYIGGNRALADAPGMSWKGFIAWLMWRSVYITKLVSFQNKVRVLFDWIKASLFGRDITTF